jgi:hypothetical protein
MPGIRFVTNLSRQKAYDAAHTAARRLYFSAQPQAEGEMIVRKGSFAGSLLLGIIPYCDFRVYVDQQGVGQVKVTLERNNPWWVGWIGKDRIKTNAQELADAMTEAFLAAGGEVLSRETY